MTKKRQTQQTPAEMAEELVGNISTGVGRMAGPETLPNIDDLPSPHKGHADPVARTKNPDDPAYVAPGSAIRLSPMEPKDIVQRLIDFGQLEDVYAEMKKYFVTLPDGIPGGVRPAGVPMMEPSAAPSRPSGFTPDAINDIFTYHAPTPDQIEKYRVIREHARLLAGAIVGNTPASADQTAAIRLLRQCVMTANQAIATGGKY